MQTFEEAKRIGITACVDKLGYDFVKKYEDTACSAYGDEGDHVSCFVGVSTEPETPWTGGTLVLDDSPKLIIARKDMQMSPGKLTAQVGHDVF